MNTNEFAAFISYLTAKCGNTFNAFEVETVAQYVTSLVPNKASEADIQTLMAEMNNPTGIIPAIKAYRALTNAGLKEAKDAVEKHYRRVPSDVAKAS